MTSNLRISQHAQADMDAILAYTYRTWGMAQMLAYESTLRKAFDVLMQHPYSGAVMPALPYRSCVAGKHLVIYAVDAATIEIIRVLHQQMDIRETLFQ